MGAYAPENSCFLTIPTSLGAYAPEKVPRSHFFAIFDLPIFTYCYLPWWIPDIYLDFKRKRFLFGSRIYFRKVGGYAPDYLKKDPRNEDPKKSELYMKKEYGLFVL